MSDLNKKNINYGMLSRFYQDLKSHDLSGIIPYTAGTNISIDNNQISCTYSLPTANSNTLGGVKVGDGLNIDASSLLSVDSDAIYDIIKILNYNTLPIEEQYLTFEAAEDNCDITYFVNYASTLGIDYPIEVSKDLLSWTIKIPGNINSPTVLETLNTGEKLYVRGNNGRNYSTQYGSSYHTQFGTTDRCYIYGNIMSLILKRKFETSTLYYGSALIGLFLNATSILSHPTKELILSSKILTSSCYQRMFYGCTSLTSAPILPATTLADSCYREMFLNCTSLTSAPILPATTLADSCYRSMFSGCTSLTSSPKLPAATLTNLCYYEMFKACSSLNFVTCLATSIVVDSTKYWLLNVSGTGTFVKDSSAIWSEGNNGIPTGWSTQNYVEPVVPIVIDESTFSGASLTVDGSQPSIVASDSTTIVWDDLASNIPLGKSVEVSVVLINTGNSALTPTMSGNYQMLGNGNISIQPTELGLYKARYISSLNKWLVEAVSQYNAQANA